MRIGTKSVLFGSHCWFIHPLFVWLAWIKLSGWTWDVRIVISCIIHDWGYWGKPNIDGPEGEDHVWLGARIAGYLFDGSGWLARLCNHIWGAMPYGSRDWRMFCAAHSRSIAKKLNLEPSRLCVADKYALSLTPWSLYVPLVCLSGEWKEFRSQHAPGGKYEGDSIDCSHGVRAWFRGLQIKNLAIID